MNSFLTSLKADLFDRRLRAVLLALGLALVGALVYALTGASGTASAPAPAAVPPASGSAIAAVAAPTNGNRAVAETTSGLSLQREGTSRNPFTPLPGSKTTATGASTHSSGSSGSSSSHGSGNAQKSSGGSSSGGGHSTLGKSTPSTPKPKPKPVYHVAVLFGVVPKGTPPQGAQLTPYTGLTLRRKLPSTATPLLSLRAVTSGGKRAVFELLSEVLVKGSASCVPSPSQCQSIALARGQSEELEYLPPGGGRAVVYELHVVSITSSKAAAARARISLLRRARLHALSASVALAAAPAN